MGLTDEERQDLEDFVDRAQMVDRTALVRTLRDTERTELKFEFAPTQLRVSGHRADETELQTFLLAFRPFTLQKERISLGRTFNLLERRLTNDRLREAVRAIRRRWTQAQRGALPFLFNSERMTAERILDLAVNGHYFHHDDREKRELWRRLTTSPGPAAQVTDYQMLNLLHDGAMVVILTANVILEAFKTQGFV